MRYARSVGWAIGVTAAAFAAAACGSKTGGSGGSTTSASSGAGAATAVGATSSSKGVGGATVVGATSSSNGVGGATVVGATSSSSGAGGATVVGAASSSSATSASSSSGSSGGTGLWVMGYYTSWDDPANGGPYPVSAIDWDGLTHVATAFYLPDGNGGWASGTFDNGTATMIIGAAHAHGKKAIASIGGAGSGPVFEGSTKSANLPTFVNNLEALLTMGYDGIDIDWEGGNLTAAQDQALETSLIQALRQKSPSAILTFTTGIENENFLDDLLWYGTIAGQLDQINIMSYGMSGAYQGWKSWHTSPLHWNMDSSTPTGIDASVGHYLTAGVPAAKLGVGTGFYGECYTAPVTGPDQALGGATIPVSDNAMSYANIMASYYSAGAYHYDNAAEAPYLTLSGNNQYACTFVTYEDATSIAAKGAWVKSQGLGGTIIWAISEGYVASGATVQAQNPLLEAMKTGFLQ